MLVNVPVDKITQPSRSRHASHGVDNQIVHSLELRRIPPLMTDLSTMSESLWQHVCERLAAELPEQQFNTWIAPLPDRVARGGGRSVGGHVVGR